MFSIIKKLLLAVLLIVLAVNILFRLVNFNTKEVALKKIEVVDLQGNAVDWADLKGQPMVVNFWATWCAPCIQEKPHLERARQILAPEGYRFVVASPEDRKVINTYKNKHNNYGFTYLKMLKDYKWFQIYSIPQSYVLDKDGQIVHSQTGPLEWDAPESIAMLRKLAKR